MANVTFLVHKGPSSIDVMRVINRGVQDEGGDQLRMYLRDLIG